MLQAEYDAVCPTLRTSTDVLAAAATGSFSYDALRGMYEQAYIRHMSKTAHLTKTHGPRFVQRFENGMSLLDIAEWINLSPCMVARRFLELKLKASRQMITKMLRDPVRLIEDERIRDEVVKCVANDEHAGPFIDRQRSVIGVEYEFILMERLRNIGLQFETENDLRRRGTHKTPDILLRVPVAFAGRVVRWIDSKAKFGDSYAMRKDYSDAISSYVGRFGPGMVVYWFGFISDCDVPVLSDSGVFVVEDIPKNVEMLTGTLREPDTGDTAVR